MSVRKILTYLVAVSIVLGLAAIPAAAPALAAECTRYHTVSRGETLSSIGAAYGVPWPQLAKINKLDNPRVIFTGQRLCVRTASTDSGGPVVPVTGAIPTFAISGVERNTSVTIQTANFPANDSFTVRMGAFGTRGVGGTVVQSVNSGSGGTLTFTFAIPAALAGSNRIAIRLESPTSGYFAYNWFFNSTTGATGGPTTPGGGTTYTGFPTFSISAVVRNGSVTIAGRNFPANDSFTVLMGKMGTRGVGGTVVDTYKSGTGGSFTATFAIPAGLQGQKQIAIRLQSPTSGYFAYNWFWNSNAP
jgi:LysM repeat protein